MGDNYHQREFNGETDLYKDLVSRIISIYRDNVVSVILTVRWQEMKQGSNPI